MIESTEGANYMQSLWQTTSLSYQVIHSVDVLQQHIVCSNEIIIKRQNFLASISQCSNLDSPPNRNCGVKNPPTISSFIFCSLCSLQLPHFPAVEFHWVLMYHISLCFSCVALFGPKVRGWNKADPILKLTGSPKPEPEGSPPSPGLTEAASDKGAVCYKLLRRKKRNTTGRVIWCSFDPLSPLRWKGFQFLPDEEDHFSTEHQYGLQSSAKILIRDKLLYIVWCTVLHRRSLRGQKGKNSAALPRRETV